MGPLSRLIYYSRNCIVGTQGEIDAEIRHILAVARRNNTTTGLTGALMFNNACFAQVLEGPQPAVEFTSRRIKADPRHNNFAFMVVSPVRRRSFPRWAMAYVGALSRDRENYQDIAEATGFDPTGMTSDAILSTLQGLVADTEKVPNLT